MKIYKNVLWVLGAIVLLLPSFLHGANQTLVFDAAGGLKSSADFNLGSQTVYFNKATVPTWITTMVIHQKVAGMIVNSIELSGGSGSWISGGTGSWTSTLDVSVVENSGTDRSWTFVITDDAGGIVWSLLITQEGSAVTPISCTVSFDANGGSTSPASIIRNSGAQYGALPTVTRTGYTFNGWYTAVSGGTQVTATSKVMGNVKLYAHWTAIAEDTLGGALGAVDYVWDTSADFPWLVITDVHTQGASAVRSREMAGYSTSWLSTVAVGPATLSFDYQLRTYGGHFTVECDSAVLLEWKDKYVLNMGWESKAYSIPAGRHVIKFSYTHIGIGFEEGWGNGVRLDNVSFAGGRPPARYIISFDANGGSSMPAAVTRDEGAEYGGLPSVTRTGYTFNGWYTAVSGGTQVTATSKVTGNVKLYAHWTAVKYAITYNLGGGTNASSNPMTYTIEDAVTLAAPTRSGYTFSGWTPNGGKIAKGSTGAKTFTATWTANVVLEVHNDGDREYLIGDDVSWDCNLFVVESSSAVTVRVTGLPTGLGFRIEVDGNEVMVYFTGRAVISGRYYVVCNATDATGRTASDSIWVEIVETGNASFKYVDNLDGTITLVQYNGSSVPERLVIPSVYAGKRVTGVGSMYDDNNGVSFFGVNVDDGIVIGNVLKSVVLPEGLETIGINSPFANQSGITSVEFPSTLKNIGDWAFCCCTGLKSVDLSGTALENCLWSSFAGCKAMTAVKFPSTLTTLGGLSFAWCRALKSVTFEGNAPLIQNYTSDGGRDGAKWGDWAGRIFVDSGFDFRSFDTQRTNLRYLTGITSYVKSGSSGWGTSVPGVWQGNVIAYAAEYNIRFVLDGGVVEESMLVACDAVVKLPTLASKGWMRAGRRFRGWRSSANTRLYDEGVLVFRLANPGETVTMTAIWE